MPTVDPGLGPVGPRVVFPCHPFPCLSHIGVYRTGSPTIHNPEEAGPRKEIDGLGQKLPKFTSINFPHSHRGKLEIFFAPVQVSTTEISHRFFNCYVHSAIVHFPASLPPSGPISIWWSLQTLPPAPPGPWSSSAAAAASITHRRVYVLRQISACTNKHTSVA